MTDHSGWGLAEGAGEMRGPSIMEKWIQEDFPGGTLVENLPANVGDTGSIPGPGRFHMEPLSACATATEARALESVRHSY